MRNITGPPAEGDDYFERPSCLARLQRELNHGVNLLLTSPRRVGKTSLALRLCASERHAGRHAVFLNVEDCHDELSLAEKLVDGLAQSGLHPNIISKMGLMLRSLRQALRGVKVGAAGMDMDVGATAKNDDPEINHGTLGRALESVFRRIEESSTPLLIALDELPEMLIILNRQEHGPERVSRLLHWLRSLRQTYRRQVRWLFLGSIGLDSFVDDRNLRKAINDLTTLTLEALTEEEAHAFLERLGNSNRLPLSPEVRTYIVEKLGWPLPHHLQLVFRELVNLDSAAIGIAQVETAFYHLLEPENRSQFDTWRQRLEEQLNVSDAAIAQKLLQHLCSHPKGRTRSHLLNALMKTRGSADSERVEAQIACLLPLLQRDGYLLENNGRYAFRSFLLREYWHRRHLR